MSEVRHPGIGNVAGEIQNLPAGPDYPYEIRTMEVNADMIEDMRTQMMNILEPGIDRRYYKSDMESFGRSTMSPQTILRILNKEFKRDSLSGNLPSYEERDLDADAIGWIKQAKRLHNSSINWDFDRPYKRDRYW